MPAEFKIDDFSFLTLEGHPEPPSSQLAVYSRAGVQGVQIVDENERGREFVLVSKVDCEDKEAARALYAEYVASKGSVVPLKWSGIEMDGEGFQVVVLDVKARDIRALSLGVGGLNPPSLGWLEAEWTLISVPAVSITITP